MKVFKFLLIALFLFQPIISFGQNSDSLLHLKYWNYRDRFLKYFTCVGKGQGMSLPAASINGQLAFRGDRQYVNGSDVAYSGPRPDYKNNLVYADVLAWMDAYMGTLATEYWLLKYKGTDPESLQAVSNEIYFVLFAIDRLDNYGEMYFGQSTGALNGFLVRDDIPQDFIVSNGITNYDKIAYQFHTSDNTTGAPHLYSLNVNNEIVYYGYDGIKLGKCNIWDPCAKKIGVEQWPEQEMSQDQLIGLLAGLKFIQKFVDGQLVVDPDGAIPDYAPKNIITWTAEIADRLMKHLTLDVANIRFKDGETRDRDIEEDGGYIHKTNYNIINSVRFSLLSSQEQGNYELFHHILHHGFGYDHDNPIIGDYSNYVLTNPAKNYREVYRGPQAYSLGFALHKTGFELANKNRSSVIYYPKPRVNPSKWINSKVALLNAPVTGPLAFGLYGLSADVGDMFGTLVSHSSPIWASTGVDLQMSCPWVFVAPLGNFKLTNNCLFGMNYKPISNKYWENVTQSFGNKAFFNRVFKNNDETALATNLLQWIIPASGAWTHSEYKTFSDDCNYSFNEIIYAVLNNKGPLKSKSYYQTGLDKASIFGPNHYLGSLHNAPFNKQQIFKRSVVSSTNDFGMDKHNGLHYTLLYNLYRISNILYWGPDKVPYQRNPAPFTPHRKLFIDEVLGKTIGCNYELSDSTIPGSGTPSTTYSYYNYLPHFSTIQNSYIDELVTGIAHPNYAKIGIRIPDFISNSFTIGTRTSGTNTIKGILNVKYDLEISNCKVTIDKGILKTNTPSTNEMNHLIRVTNRGALEVKNEGLIIIENNTTLEIGSGSTLIWNSGARIVLNGPNAVLHIKGKLQLQPNAIFQIESGSNGKGYIIWDNGNGSPHYGKAQLVAGNGSKILLEQTNTNQLILKVEGELGMMTGWNLTELRIQNSLVQLGPISRIVSEAKNTFFTNVIIAGFTGLSKNPAFSGKLTSEGIHVLGKNNNFTNVTIKDCNLGMKIFNVGTIDPLRLNNVNFFNCRNSLLNMAGRVIFKGGSITGNSQYQLLSGITGVGTQGASYINRVDIDIPHLSTSVSMPISTTAKTFNLQSHGTGRYFLTRCALNDADVGASMNQTYLFPACTNFIDNPNQIVLRNGSLLNATMNHPFNYFFWSSNPNGTQNHFIDGSGGASIYLDYGSNFITGVDLSYYFLKGSLEPNHLFSPSAVSGSMNSTAITARGNKWWDAFNNATLNTKYYPAANSNVKLSTAIPNRSYDINRLPDYTPVGFPNWETHRQSYCNVQPDKGNFIPTLNVDVSRIPVLISGVDNSNAFAIKIENLLDDCSDGTRDYPQLILSFDSILTKPIHDSASSLIVFLYETMHNVYMESFTDSMIDSSQRTNVLIQTYNNLIDLQNKLITNSNSQSSIWRNFKFILHRDLALIHRKFDHRVDGINHINAVITNFTESAEVEALNSWSCILEKEQQYLDSILPYDSVNLCDCISDFFNQTDTLVNYIDSSVLDSTYWETPDILPDSIWEHESYWYSDSSCENYMDSLINSLDSTFWLGKDSAWFADSFSLFYDSLYPCNDPNGNSMVYQVLEQIIIDQDKPGQKNVRNTYFESKKEIGDVPIGQQNVLQLFPNPAENKLFIVSNAPITKVILRETNGKVIKIESINIQNRLELNIDYLSRGVYFVEVNMQDEKWVGRLVVNR